MRFIYRCELFGHLREQISQFAFGQVHTLSFEDARLTIQRTIVEVQHAQPITNCRIRAMECWVQGKRISMPLGLVTNIRSLAISSGTCTETGMKPTGAASRPMCSLNCVNQQ